VALLDLGIRAHSNDADQLLREHCAEDSRLRDQLLETVQRPVSLILECRGERFRMTAQPFEADIPVGHGIGAGEYCDRWLRFGHVHCSG
jgi:hypothetical protein